MEPDFAQLLNGIAAGISNAEARWLYQLATDLPVNRVLELGSFVGRSTIALATAMQPSRGTVVACDYFPKNARDWVTGHIIEDTGKEFWHNLSKWGLARQVVTIKGDIRQTLTALGGKWGLVFIDAGHNLANVLPDSMWAWNHVADGGYLVWHDYGRENWPDVKLTVDILAQKWGREIRTQEYLAIVQV